MGDGRIRLMGRASGAPRAPPAAPVYPRSSVAQRRRGNHRSEAREVIYRFRKLSPDDQQAVVEFLKQL